ncbi:putative multi antimicrobial extrusion protein [Helianthus debilis subsp. tardiflorus]
MGSAVETLCGQAFGARKYNMLGVYLQRSAIVLLVTAIPITIIYVFCKPILISLGQSPSMASAASLFVYGLIPQVFAYAINFPIQKFLQAQSIVAPSAFISAGTLVVHLMLCWIMVYKLGLGLLGASLTLSLSWWIIIVGQFVYILMSHRCKATWTGFNSMAFGGLWEFVKLSSGSAVMLCLETWYFQILVLIAGLLENPELALDALSVWPTRNICISSTNQVGQWARMHCHTYMLLINCQSSLFCQEAHWCIESCSKTERFLLYFLLLDYRFDLINIELSLHTNRFIVQNVRKK